MVVGRLKDKVAIVTGAGSIGPGWGNGKAVAVLFAREGAKVLALDINLEAAQETAAIVVAEGGTCTAHRTDVTQANQVAAAVTHCIDLYGRIDVLHNNVGIAEVGGAIEASEESWDRVNAVNLKSMFLTCKHVLPHMVARGGGAIVNVASIAGIRWMGVPYISYSATKAAILAFSRSVALEHASDSIRCNSILPGLMDTPMVEHALHEFYADGDIARMKEIRGAQCPTGRMGDAWDVAFAALYLASDEAKYVTAAELVVDGGISAKSA
jgi:NAD(P)-dependent dehydrogenase (short-subunit alcohol dehydrogenase family)